MLVLEGAYFALVLPHILTALYVGCLGVYTGLLFCKDQPALYLRSWPTAKCVSSRPPALYSSASFQPNSYRQRPSCNTEPLLCIACHCIARYFLPRTSTSSCLVIAYEDISTLLSHLNACGYSSRLAGRRNKLDDPKP